jgi:hypothetical protein
MLFKLILLPDPTVTLPAEYEILLLPSVSHGDDPVTPLAPAAPVAPVIP